MGSGNRLRGLMLSTCLPCFGLALAACRCGLPLAFTGSIASQILGHQLTVTVISGICAKLRNLCKAPKSVPLPARNFGRCGMQFFTEMRTFSRRIPKSSVESSTMENAYLYYSTCTPRAWKVPCVSYYIGHYSSVSNHPT